MNVRNWKKTRTCQQCNYSTKDYRNFTRHLYVHKQGAILQCSQCSYVSHRISDMKRHSFRHKSREELELAATKSYACQECSYTTHNKYSFSRHLLVHKTKEERVKLMEENPPLECPLCPYTTRKNSTLKSHSIAQHSCELGNHI